MPSRLTFLKPQRVRAAICALGLGLSLTPAQALPSFSTVRSQWHSSETLVLARDGALLQRMRTNDTVRRGQWVALAQVSPALRSAMLLSEDKRFYEHSGVDWQAISSAAWGNLWNTRTRGASTLTMQLVGLIDEPGGTDLRQRPGGRSVLQKAGQVAAADVLDRRWRKDQILEAYLNLVPFRGELVGIDALSRTLFGKAPQGLDAREAAVAAALVRAPNASADTVARRACGVLQDMQAARVVVAAPSANDCDALALFVAGTLGRRAFDAASGIAPHAARRAVSALPVNAVAPAQLTTTLRAQLQRFAVQTLSQHLRELSGRNVQDGAIVVLDNATGEVLAWVGSSGELSAAPEVDAVLARRQPGSTLKPFLYGLAVAEHRLTAASLIDDSAARMPTGSGLYIPQNYDRQFKGWVSARTALASSLNIPAVRTLAMVSPDAFFEQLQALGLGLRESGGYYGLSLALGSSEVTLLQLANAYRALANGGQVSDVAPLELPAEKTSRSAPAFTRVLDAGAAFIVGDMLSDPEARARTFGTDSVLATRSWSAVKTGTSKDMRDNWAMGWSSRYTVGVWVGNAAGGAMHDVSGVSGAAPVWAAVMAYLHTDDPSRAPAPPAGVVRAKVQFGADARGQPLEATRSEWFVAGTQQTLVALDSIAVSPYSSSARGLKSLKNSHAADVLSAGPAGPAGSTGLTGSTDAPARSPFRIAEPAQGTIVALDPDIPVTHQRLRFVASGAAPGTPLSWQLDGKPMGRGLVQAWLPWPGRHRLQLLDTAGRVVDETHFEVRGASAARGARAP